MPLKKRLSFGDTLVIGDIEVTVTSPKSHRVELWVSAPADMEIYLDEAQRDAAKLSPQEQMRRKTLEMTRRKQ